MKSMDPEVKRTIPQLRALIGHQLDLIIRAARGDTAVAACIGEIRRLVEETKRRSPSYIPARVTCPDPDEATVRAIRRYKEANPDMSFREISILLDTSTRCVSYAISGRRDGRPVYDENGRKIARRSRRRELAGDSGI